MSRSPRRARNLREIASVIFALTAVLPLLLFLYMLYRYGLLDQSESQFTLLAALFVAILGFFAFQQVMVRIARLARAMGEVQIGAAVTPLVVGAAEVAEMGQILEAFNRLLEELRGTTRELENLVYKLATLSELTELASRIPNIGELLGLVLERAMRTVNATIGSIMLVEADGQTLRITASRGLEESVAAETVLRVGEGIAGWVVQQGEPLLVDDIEQDSRFARANDPKYGGGSFLCLPVRVKERVIGVINLAKKGDRGSFSPSDLQFLNTLLAHIGFAIENARLLEEARQAATRLGRVVEEQQGQLTLAEQQVLQAEKLAALGELVAGVAHEINNPLAVVIGAAELLAPQVPEPLRASLTRILEAGNRAGRIVEALLTFARRQTPERRCWNLPALVQEVLTLKAADLQLSHIAVELDLAPDLPAVWVDGGQIHQVLLNLINNAHQAMAGQPQGGRLRLVGTRLPPNSVRLVVEDSGPGIAAEHLPRVFDPFFTTKGRGTGLGLSISYGIVQEHGGTLSVTSVPGEKTAFTIDLPVGEPTELPPGPAPIPAKRPVAGRQVLVVEDEAQIRELLREYLQSEGYAIEAAASGEDALQVLSRRPPDLVICDLRLPGIDATELYRQAVVQQPELASRFLFITGGLVSERLERFLRETGTPLLRKPFSIAQLDHALQECLG
ncbi:MAG: GAF domain-containing protein [Deltaproteobacteria bacterium]|nr:GAF domain-containing protein [Deltaproteobacteria bacterium]